MPNDTGHLRRTPQSPEPLINQQLQLADTTWALPDGSFPLVMAVVPQLLQMGEVSLMWKSALHVTHAAKTISACEDTFASKWRICCWNVGIKRSSLQKLFQPRDTL